MRWIAIIGLLACGPRVEIEEPETVSEHVACVLAQKVDLLIVLDDGPAMWHAREGIQTNVQRLVEIFERPDQNLQYRIAVTTTSVDNPGCDPGEARNGAFATRSCRMHLGDFEDPSGEADAGGCSACALDDLSLMPTPTHVDPVSRPRPWIERSRDGSNLPSGVSGPEAAACLVPQGFSGCRFASPFSALASALDAIDDPARPEYGFFRPDAVPVILVITAGDDCSHRPQHADIFSPDGSRTFWSDPGAGEATPAVCWNAGVLCTGAPPEWDDCHAQDHTPDGTPTDGVGVLRSVDEVALRLQALEDTKSLFPNMQLVVGIVAGVSSWGTSVFADGVDEEFLATWGIGPGCHSSAAVARPPVRLAELAHAFAIDGVQAASLCSDDYAPALEVLLSHLAVQTAPPCFPHCARDTDPDSATLEPSCTVVEHVTDATGMHERPVPPCETGPSLPAGADVCWYPRWDVDALTPTRDDDLSPYCQEAGHNLEIGLHRAHAAVDHACIEATCETVVGCRSSGL